MVLIDNVKNVNQKDLNILIEKVKEILIKEKII